MILNRISTAAAFVLLGTVSLAVSQESSLQIRAVLHNSTQADAKFYVGKVGEKMVPLNLADEGLTDPQKVETENGSLSIFTSDAIDKSNALASLGATIKIPPGSARFIVIVVPANPGTKTPYQILLLEDDPKSFPWGESRVVNLTPVDFALEVSDQKLRLPGGKITAVPKVTKVDEYNRAQTDFYYKQGEQWVVAAQREMTYVNGLRRVFVIYKTPGALAPDVRTLVDQLPAVVDKPR